MDYWDILMVSAAAAACFWAIMSTYIQKRWRIYDLFISKKYGFLAHAGLMVVVSVQLVTVTILDILHHWNFQWFSLLGVPIMVAAVWLFYRSVREKSLATVFNGHLFRYRERKNGPLWDLLIEPFYVAYVAFYVGLGLFVGHMAVETTAVTLAFGLGLYAYLVPTSSR